MAHFPIRFLLSLSYLLIRASYLLASIKCCPGDTTCSQCWMCEGCDLRSCWDKSVSEIEACDKINPSLLVDKLQCLCTSYSHLSLCWKSGACCSEFSPTLAAAGNLCNLLTHPADQITPELFDKVANDAANTRKTIYHNDRGTDVPKLKMYVQPRSHELAESESESEHTRDFTAQTNHPDNYYSHTSNEHEKNKDKSNYQSEDNTSYKDHYNPNNEIKSSTNHESQSEAPTWKNSKSVSKSSGTTSTKKTETQQQNSEVYKSRSSHKTQSHGWPDHHKIHHQAKCSRQGHKCQSQIASQYQKARRDRSSQTLVKRGQSPHPQSQSLLTNHELWKRNSAKCGLDFQGVPYPKEIPPTVAKEFAKFEYSKE